VVNLGEHLHQRPATFRPLTASRKCQSSYTEARNTTIRCVAAVSTVTTLPIVVLWGSVWEYFVEQIIVPRHVELFQQCLKLSNFIVIVFAR